jgi:hypothetical protein
MNLFLSILVLAAVALLAGGVFAWRKGRSRKQAVLMVVAGAVMLADVLLLTVPNSSGVAPVDKMQELNK